MADAQRKRRRFLSWSTFFILVLLLAILLALLWIGFNQAVTDSTPMPLPPVTLTKAQIREVQKRVDTFRDAVQARQPVAPLALTSDEVNALIATDPDLEPLKDHLHVKLQGNQAKAQFSFPTAQLGLPKGRYLNGSGTFTVSLHNGVLRLNAKNLTVKRRALPGEIARHFENKNLADSINENPRAQAAFERLENIEIRNGRIVVTPRKE